MEQIDAAMPSERGKTLLAESRYDAIIRRGGVAA